MDARTGPAARLTAFGNELISIHLWLREELARLGSDVDANKHARQIGVRGSARARRLAHSVALGDGHGVFIAATSGGFE